MQQPNLGSGLIPRDVEELEFLSSTNKLQGLTPAQLQIFSMCIDQLETFVSECPESDDLLYNWNQATWIDTLFRIAGSITNPIKDAVKDCWLSEFTLDAHKYPSFKVTPVELSTKSGQGRRFYGIKNAPEHRVKPFKVLNALAHPDLLLEFQKRDQRMQTAHLCYHSPQRCCNWRHMIPLISDKENKEMHHCVLADARACPGHGPDKVHCIYTDPEGLWIPQKNAKTLE